MQVGDYACAYSSLSYIDAYLQHYRGVPEPDDFWMYNSLGMLEAHYKCES